MAISRVSFCHPTICKIINISKPKVVNYCSLTHSWRNFTCILWFFPELQPHSKCHICRILHTFHHKEHEWFQASMHLRIWKRDILTCLWSTQWKCEVFTTNIERGGRWLSPVVPSEVIRLPIIQWEWGGYLHEASRVSDHLLYLKWEYCCEMTAS